jgi:DNA-binding LacI/PurR family transcriptional regulator
MSAKRVTMQQVADRAGVSRTTVSFVLNNTPNVSISPETRARIWQAAAELNYARDFAAHSLATGRSHTIAFVLRQKPDELLVNAFLGGILSGVSHAIHQDNYHLLFYAIGHDIPAGAYTELIRSQRVDGLLISGPVINDLELAELYEDGVPIVIQGTPDIPELYSVDVDNAASARTAVEHLIALGHQCIGHITNGPLTYTASRDRLLGYRQALQTVGLPCQDDYVYVGDTFTDAGGYAGMQTLLALPERPTAIFAASDVIALGAIRAVQDSGLRVPDDVSIVGFDDIPLARDIAPGLTSVRIPVIELGVSAGTLLMSLIRGEEPDQQHYQLDTQFIIRGSTAPPRTYLS